MNALKRLESCGQFSWLDYLKRSFIEKGDLHNLNRTRRLEGSDLNPDIF